MLKKCKFRHFHALCNPRDSCRETTSIGPFTPPRQCFGRNLVVLFSKTLILGRANNQSVTQKKPSPVTHPPPPGGVGQWPNDCDFWGGHLHGPLPRDRPSQNPEHKTTNSQKTNIPSTLTALTSFKKKQRTSPTRLILKTVGSL